MKIKATTLSVILKDSDTVHCHVSIGDSDCNLTLRFDRGLRAQLCGYPMSWGVHDVNVDYYNSESPTYAELVECDGVLEDGQPYVSPELEREILIKLKRSIIKQFNDPFWVDHSVPNQRRKQTILNKIQRAIIKLGRAA